MSVHSEKSKKNIIIKNILLVEIGTAWGRKENYNEIIYPHNLAIQDQVLHVIKHRWKLLNSPPQIRKYCRRIDSSHSKANIKPTPSYAKIESELKLADIGPKLVLQSGRSPRISHQAKQISNLPFKYYWPTCEEEFNLLLFDRKQVPIIDILEGQFNDNSFVLNSYSWPTGFNCGSPPFKWTSEN